MRVKLNEGQVSSGQVCGLYEVVSQARPTSANQTTSASHWVRLAIPSSLKLLRKLKDSQ